MRPIFSDDELTNMMSSTIRNMKSYDSNDDIHSSYSDVDQQSEVSNDFEPQFDLFQNFDHNECESSVHFPDLDRLGRPIKSPTNGSSKDIDHEDSSRILSMKQSDQEDIVSEIREQDSIIQVRKAIK